MSAPKEPVWNETTVKALLLSSEQACVRALQLLLDRQTRAEQDTKSTKERNSRGFNAHDAALLTDIAQKLPRYGNRLSKDQFHLVKWRLRKYWRQILEEIPVEKRLISEKAQKILASVVAELEEQEMQRMEAEADRKGTERDERNKHRARSAMEGAFS